VSTPASVASVQTQPPQPGQMEGVEQLAEAPKPQPHERIHAQDKAYARYLKRDDAARDAHEQPTVPRKVPRPYYPTHDGETYVNADGYEDLQDEATAKAIWGDGKYAQVTPAFWGIEDDKLKLKQTQVDIARSLDAGKLTLDDAYRAYKHTPHQPAAVFLKYLVHRFNHLDAYDDPAEAAKLDRSFLSLAQQGKAYEKNGHLAVADLHRWTKLNATKLLPALLASRERLQREVLGGVGLNVRHINGEPHVALTRGLDSDVMTDEHALSSWADVPDTGFGTQMHHAWVPVRDLWFSYDHHDSRVPSGSAGPENEWLVSHTAPRYEATREDQKSSRLKNVWRGWADADDARKDVLPHLKSTYLDSTQDAELAHALTRLHGTLPPGHVGRLLEHPNAGPLTLKAARDLWNADSWVAPIPENDVPDLWLPFPAAVEHARAAVRVGGDTTDENAYQRFRRALKNPKLTREDLVHAVQTANPAALHADSHTLLAHPAADSELARGLWQRMRAENLPPTKALQASPLLPNDILDQAAQAGYSGVLANPNHTEKHTERILGRGRRAAPRRGQAPEAAAMESTRWKDVAQYNARLSPEHVTMLRDHAKDSSAPIEVRDILKKYATQNPNATAEGLRPLLEGERGATYAKWMASRAVKLPGDIQVAVVNKLIEAATTSTDGSFERREANSGLHEMTTRDDLTPEAVRALLSMPEAKNVSALFSLKNNVYRNKHVTPEMLEAAWPKGEDRSQYDWALSGSVGSYGGLAALHAAIWNRRNYAERRLKEHLVKPLPSNLGKSEKDGIWHAQLRGWLQQKKREQERPTFYHQVHINDLERVKSEGVLHPEPTDEVLDGYVVWARPAKDHHLHEWTENARPGRALISFETDEPATRHDDRVYWTRPVQVRNVKTVGMQMAKTHGPLKFPNLGLPDDRRPTLIVQTPDQQKRVNRAMSNAAFRAKGLDNVFEPGEERVSIIRRDSEAREGLHYGMASHSAPDLAYATSDAIRQKNSQETFGEPDRATGTPTDPTGGTGALSTTLHENMHSMFTRVGKKYGEGARKNLVRNLLRTLPGTWRDAIGYHTEWRRGAPDEGEESLTCLLNYLNNPREREAFYESAPGEKGWLSFEDPQYHRVHHTFMKQAYQMLRNAAAQADENWLRADFTPPLQKEPTHKAEGDLEKAHGPFTLPKLGIADDRRETPIVTTQRQVDGKGHLMANAAVNGMPGSIMPRAEREKMVADAQAAVRLTNGTASVAATPNAISFSMSNKLRAERRARRGSLVGPADLDPNNHPNAAWTTQEHENLHLLLNRVQAKYGREGRHTLVQNLVEAIPSEHRNTLLSFMSRRIPGSVTDAAKKDYRHEEVLTTLLNYLNNPAERTAYYKAKGMPDEHQRAHHTSMKRAYEALRGAAEVATPAWTNILYPWRQRGQQDFWEWSTRGNLNDKKGDPWLAGRKPTKKSEGALNLPSGDLDEGELQTARAMLGHNDTHQAALDAAHFLVGRKQHLDLDRFHTALALYGCHERAALYAVGLSDSATNLRSLRGVLSIGGLQKSEEGEPEHVVSIHSVQPGTEDAADTAASVQRAVQAGMLKALHLNGKHSKGATAARDPESGYVWLLKPGSGKQSPAAGARDDKASQSRREAAFFHVSKLFDLEKYFPHADLLLVNAEEWAAMRLLGPSFKTLDEKNQEEDAHAREVLQPYLEDGRLHRWGILDYVLGNTDSHGQNIMVSPSGSVALIDHGAAFAGEGFDPAHDHNSFIPYYLRAFAPFDDFKLLKPEQRIRYMPKLDRTQDAALKAWLQGVNDVLVEQTIERFGIDPKPSMERLHRVRALADGPGNLSEAINGLWAGTV
jgi:hypothetical protein